jgi:dipeptidase
VPDRLPPLSCDTFVALAGATAEGATLLGKNSDRYPWECQRIVSIPAREHPRGARVQCQYIDVPQVERTARVLGAQPYWLWGFEHGVNEHGVAIGNEMVVTREPVAAAGLLGMDLVRLGLERGRSAAEAVEIMSGLLQVHGQGGSGQPHFEWAYHNSFLVADRRDAWVLETSGRHWAARAVASHANITNHVSIGSDWDRLGPDVQEHARRKGWAAPGSRLDFARAYRDTETLPPHVSEGRGRRGAALLAASGGRLTLEALRDILRDHYDAGRVYRPGRDPGEAEYFSLCMHGGELMSTTASMVAVLGDEASPPMAWMALGTPCVSVFLPYYLEGEVSEAVSRGGKEPSLDSPWWSFRELLSWVEADPHERGPRVRAYWDALEQELTERARQVEARATDLRARGDRTGAARLLTEFMTASVAAMLRALGERDGALGRPSVPAAS